MGAVSLLNKECSTHKRSAMLALLGLLLAGAEPSSQVVKTRMGVSMLGKVLSGG